jgi:hypothetical protein
MFGVVGRRSDKEREVAMHSVMAALHFIGQGFDADGERIGVGHLEHRGHSAHHRRKGPL